VPAGVATASVLGWRLISHWIPILVGLIMLPTLRRGQSRDTAEPDQAEQRRGG
jgi:uncharacterized membrane protein YbhN (UPF0104 family)